VFEVIATATTIEQLNRKECVWISSFPKDQLYNMRSGGDSGGTMSSESIEKIRMASTGRHHSEETKARLRALKLGKKRPDLIGNKYALGVNIGNTYGTVNKGKPMSELHKQRIGDARRGKKYGPHKRDEL
jgi:hypothetical protein